jgi:serine/threonine-protein phosphatase PP1 catalytic subunit
MHGGLASHICDKTVNPQGYKQMIKSIGRDEPGEIGMQAELIWNDPETDIGNNFIRNFSRGCCNIFGEKVWDPFLNKHDLDLIVRAHTCP